VSEAPGASGQLTVRLAANSLVQAVGTVVASAVSFVTFVAVTRGLGPEAFGDLTAASVFLYVPVVLADVGYSAAVLREISTSPERTEGVMRATVPLRTIVSAVSLAAAIGIGLAIPFNDQTKTAILIGAAGSFFWLMTLTVLPVLQARLAMQWSVAATVAGRIVTLVLTLGSLAAGYGFKAVVAAQVVGMGVTFLLHLVVVARLVSLRPRFDFGYWRRLSAVALVLGLAIALAQIYFRVDTLLLALIRSPEEVGIYGAAYRFIELSDLAVAAIGWSVVPPLARFLADEFDRARRLVQRAFDVLIGTAALLATAMLAFADEIVRITAGAEFSESATALMLLSPYVLLSFANGLFWRVLLTAGRDRTLLAVSSSILTLNIVLNTIFLPLYGFKAAAVLSVACEVAGLIPIALVMRQLGLLPNLRYAPAVALAAGVMGAASLALPGPRLAVFAAGALAYVAVLLAMPGTGRDVFFGHLWPAGRRLVSR
jgi:O-antigen/teichoic acid export membrane protein